MKRYVGSNNEYLKITEYLQSPLGWCILWFFPNNDDVDMQQLGALLGEFEDTDVAPTNIADYESWTAQKAVKPYVTGKSVKDGSFVFATKHAANAALKAANAALHKGVGKPWPEWALKAKEAGWTPPEGWKP